MVSGGGHQALARALIQRIKALSQPIAPQATELLARLGSCAHPRAILFDVYGTLLVSGSGDIGTTGLANDERAFAEALAHLGLATRRDAATAGGAQLLRRQIEEAHRSGHERGVEFSEVDIVRIWRSVLQRLPRPLLKDHRISDETVQALAVEYECRVNPVWPMPGVLDTLLSIRDKGVLLGIVSNAQFYTPLTLEALLGHAPTALGFSEELCAWSYKLLEAKPSLRLFRTVLDPLQRRHGILPEEVLYVGNDMLKDIWPATQLGCSTALFAGDKRSLRLRSQDPRCRGVEPTLILTELPQLSRLLADEAN